VLGCDLDAVVMPDPAPGIEVAAGDPAEWARISVAAFAAAETVDRRGFTPLYSRLVMARDA
ncbi:MAG: hypothetical protein ACR2LU_12165, partial [Luteitalea sp.]